MNIYPKTQSKRRLIQTAAFGVPEYEMKWEGTYKPRISSEHLSRLWVLKQSTKKPITKLVAEALDLYLAQREGGENMLIVIRFEDPSDPGDINQTVLAKSEMSRKKVEELVEEGIRKVTGSIENWTYKDVFDEVEKLAKGKIKYIDHEYIEIGL